MRCNASKAYRKDARMICRYRSMPPRQAALCLCMMLTAQATPAHADDEETRAAAATAAQSKGPGFSSQWGDFAVNWKPYVETEAGIDTNPDNRFDQDGSGFVKLETGMRATMERAKEYYALTLKGRFLDFRDLEDEQHRPDFKAAVDTSFTLSDTETLTAGTYFLRDLISLAEADIFHSYLEYAVRTDSFRLKLTGKNHTEHNFDNAAQGTERFDTFVISRPKAFDYARSDGKLSILAFAQGMLQPFFIYDFGHIDYYNQYSAASLDRDATEHFGIGGLRFQPDRNFRIDVGYRLNARDFEDRVTTHKTTDFIDINVFWQPVETLRFTGVVERYFDEATTAFGVVDDVKTYGMTFEWDLDPKWRATGTAYYDRETALGDTLRFDKVTTTMSVTHYWDKNIELFVSGLAKWVEEDLSGESYDRYKIGSGIRVNF